LRICSRVKSRCENFSNDKEIKKPRLRKHELDTLTLVALHGYSMLNATQMLVASRTSDFGPGFGLSLALISLIASGCGPPF
jgi:hypothetical protein